MTDLNPKGKDSLKLTHEEAESLGVEWQEPKVVPEAQQDRMLHEQVVGALTEDDVAEALTGEVTPESREEVEEAFADAQEESLDQQGD